jgi:hypothetical protein
MTSRVRPPHNTRFVVITAQLIVGLALAALGDAQAQTPAIAPENPTPPPLSASAPTLTPTSAPQVASQTATPSPEVAPHIPIRVALQTEAAVGVVKGSFYNHLLGARVDLQFSSRVSFGGYLGYVNLKGKDGRAHSVLPTAQVEYLVGDPASRVRIPLRFASGYLPGNGPVVRAATGLAFALGPRVDLITELVAPMVWLTNNQMLMSMNLSLELAVRL